MKKAVIVFIVAAMVLVTTGIWFFNSANRFRILDIVSFGIIVVLIGFAAFIGYKKLMSARRGEPAEDELLDAGILAMALTFAVFWLIFHFKGVENE